MDFIERQKGKIEWFDLKIMGSHAKLWSGLVCWNEPLIMITANIDYVLVICQDFSNYSLIHSTHAKIPHHQNSSSHSAGGAMETEWDQVTCSRLKSGDLLQSSCASPLIDIIRVQTHSLRFHHPPPKLSSNKRKQTDLWQDIFQIIFHLSVKISMD